MRSRESLEQKQKYMRRVDIAADNACRMEYVISPELMETLRNFVNDDKERLVMETLCG